MVQQTIHLGNDLGWSGPGLPGKLWFTHGERLSRAATATKMKRDHITVEQSDVFNQQTGHSLPISMGNGWIAPHTGKVFSQLQNGLPLLFTDPLTIPFPQPLTFLLGIREKF